MRCHKKGLRVAGRIFPKNRGVQDRKVGRVRCRKNVAHMGQVFTMLPEKEVESSKKRDLRESLSYPRKKKGRSRERGKKGERP